MNKQDFIEVNTAIEEVVMDGEKVLRVVKANKLMEFDENTFAKKKNVDFHNGIIKVKMLSRLLPDAPDFARGFIGIAFRINENNSAFESFYVRPTNGMTDDPVRKAHGSQYFSYPKYTFEYFRENNIAMYEAPIDFGLNEWVDLSAVIDGDKAEFFINNSTQPLLAVGDLKMGRDAHGGVGLFVDIGTEAFFKDLEIVKKS